MPSREIDLDTSAEPRSEGGVLYRLLDPAFGLLVWAVHFLVVYVGAAIACVLRLDADAAIRATIVTILVALTLLAAGIASGHAVRTWRRFGTAGDKSFLVRMTAGLDALAALAILWQLFPLLMVPLCR